MLGARDSITNRIKTLVWVIDKFIGNYSSLYKHTYIHISHLRLSHLFRFLSKFEKLPMHSCPESYACDRLFNQHLLNTAWAQLSAGYEDKDRSALKEK